MQLYARSLHFCLSFSYLRSAVGASLDIKKFLGNATTPYEESCIVQPKEGSLEFNACVTALTVDLCKFSSGIKDTGGQFTAGVEYEMMLMG
jgi:hypothetical protein